MPLTKSKQFGEISVRLEKMADGVAIHNKEAIFPVQLKEKDLRDKRTNLENLRQTYEELQTKARLAYDEYANSAQKLEEELSKNESALYGSYGKKNQVLTDFGLEPWKKTGKTGPRKTKTG